MSDEIQNQPAFPQHSWKRVDKVEVGECLPGMTLRDYFAAKAMQGWLAHFKENAQHPGAQNSKNRPQKGTEYRKMVMQRCRCDAASEITMINGGIYGL